MQDLMKDQKTEVQRPPYLKVGIYSLVVNISLVVVKLILSFITGSIALRADAIHSSVDVFGSVALIVGLIIANRKSSKFPYGLYKVENVVAVVISLLLFVTAYEIVIEAIKGETSTVPYSSWVLGVVGALILVPYLFSRYEIKVGNQYNSPSLVADGKQFRADVLSASIVFFALLAQYFNIQLDRIAAGIVAIFIAYAGWGLLSSSMRVLLDASIDSNVLSQIRSIVESEPAVGSVKEVTGRNSGRYIFVEVDIALKESDLNRAHQITQRIEHKIKQVESGVDRILIHYQPETKTVVRYALPVTSQKDKLSLHFGESPYFLLADMDTRINEFVRQEVIENPYLGLEKSKGIEVAKFLLGYKLDFIITKEDLSGKGPGYAFSDAGVNIMQTESWNVDDVLNQLISGSIAA